MISLQKFVSGLLALFTIFISIYEKMTIEYCQAASISRPHIILIVADDMGWNDVSFHGADEIPTPNIDALAYNGVILNRHYVQAVCTPSRAALMTGRYPIRNGMQGRPLRPGEPRGLPLNVTIMPEYLHQLGYETRLLGKWHLGYHTEKHTPTHRGFNSFFGYYSGSITYFNKTVVGDLRNGSFVNGYDLHRDGVNGLQIEFNNTEYFTDLITTEAEKIIKNNGNEKPLFLEIAHSAPHASDSIVESFEVRNTTENDETFSYIKDISRRKYAGMMKAMDDSIGRVVKALADADMLDNIIIVFISDNGAPTVANIFPTPGSNYPFRGVKKTTFEGGVRGAACIFSPLIKNVSRVSDELIHMTDWLPTLYSAAGGKVADLGEIDGVDQWKSLVDGSTSPRKDLLVNINEITGEQAAIFGRYKLVEGADSFGGGYYGENEKNSSLPKYNTEEVMLSTAGQTISQLTGFESVTFEKAQVMRENATIKCQRLTSPPNCFNTCLFDIFEDPCETQDLSDSYTEDLQALKSYIQKYREDLVPQQTDIIDLCSLPMYFNGTWQPWRRDDANLSTIIPESVCRNN